MSRQFKLMIAGASVRWLVEIATDLDCALVATDLFADMDTRSVADCIRLDRFSSLPKIVDDVGPDALILAGGLEAQRTIVQLTSEKTKLLNAAAHQLSRCNDPNILSAVFGPQFPESHDQLAPDSEPKNWVQKSRFSSGGTGVQDCDETTDPNPANEGVFFQRRIIGDYFGASFLATDNQCTLLGVCQQRFGPNSDAHRPYLYSGSIGPLRVNRETEQSVSQLGIVAANAFELRGLFGIDYAITDKGELFVIEINPRPTASMELIHLATVPPYTRRRNSKNASRPQQTFESGHSQIRRHNNLVRQHLASFGINLDLKENRPRGVLPIAPNGQTQILEKSIIYNVSDDPISMTSQLFRFLTTAHPDYRFADISREGTQIAPGHPIVTLIANGPNNVALSDTLGRLKTHFWEQVDSQVQSPL